MSPHEKTEQKEARETMPPSEQRKGCAKVAPDATLVALNCGLVASDTALVTSDCGLVAPDCDFRAKKGASEGLEGFSEAPPPKFSQFAGFANGAGLRFSCMRVTNIAIRCHFRKASPCRPEIPSHKLNDRVQVGATNRQGRLQHPRFAGWRRRPRSTSGPSRTAARKPPASREGRVPQAAAASARCAVRQNGATQRPAEPQNHSRLLKT